MQLGATGDVRQLAKWCEEWKGLMNCQMVSITKAKATGQQSSPVYGLKSY